MFLPSWFPGQSENSSKVAERPRRKSGLMSVPPKLKPDVEWLRTNRGGSFAMGTIDRRPRRKYHGLLTIREPVVGDPLNVVAEVEEWFIVGDQRFALHSYDWGGWIEPMGIEKLVDFEEGPTWTYEFATLTVTRELRLEDDADAVWLLYTIEGLREPVDLRLRPLIRCRPLHKLTFANAFMNGEIRIETSNHLQVGMHPYKDGPNVVMSLHGIEGAFRADGHWYEGVHYEWERDRGYDDAEDLFTPGEIKVDIDRDCGFGLRLGTTPHSREEPRPMVSVPSPDRSFLRHLDRASDAYLVRLKSGRSGVIAGYPWFGEWSRDALISLPGLCLERGKTDDAIAILESLQSSIENDGLIPNIPRCGTVPANFDSIDASLLFMRATKLTAEKSRSRRITALKDTCRTLIDRIAEGADSRIHIDPEGFLFVEPGPWALTWMDASIDGQPVTPRHGFAVDLNALWLSALSSALAWAKKRDPAFVKRWRKRTETLAQQFEARFWLEEEGFFTDTHTGETPDRRLRPNQLWALTLPGIPLKSEHRRRALDAVRSKLLTPVGLRTLSPDDSAYQPVYRGDQSSRDRAYHQGTVWPWLLGLYADALVAVEGTTKAHEELLPILTALRTHFLREGCIGQIGEVFDADPPHRPGGTPAQAWSIAEVLRVAKMASP